MHPCFLRKLISIFDRLLCKELILHLKLVVRLYFILDVFYVQPVQQARPASYGQFESGSNLGPGGRGWGNIGLSDSQLGSYDTAAISSDGVPCASVAK